MRIQGLQRKLLLSLILGAFVVLGLALYGDGSALVSALRTFEWNLLPLILGLTLLNYALRFVKWNYYLNRIGVTVSPLDSFAIFSSGLAMAMTPAKVGEVVKPLLLKMRTGTEVSRSIPVVLAERLTDGIAMLILAIAGLLLSHLAWQVLALAAIFAGTLALVLGTESGTDRLRRWSLHLPFLSKRSLDIERFLASTRLLLRGRPLLLAVGLGVISWSGEAVAFYLVLVGLHLHASFTLLVQATFVLATSTIVGSLSLLPGGLGAAEASVTGLLVVLIHVGRSKASAATLLIRFCTLWFGVGLGVLAMFVFRHRFLGRPGATLRQEDADQAADALMLPPQP